MLLMVKLAVPVFVRVTVCAELDVPTFWEVKERLEGERVIAPERPVPLRVRLCWLPVALLLLSVIVTLAGWLPVALGVNVALMVQVPFWARVLGDSGQVLDSPYSPALAPPKAMVVIVRAALPVLVKVTV